MHVAEADAGRTDRRHAARRQKVADVRRPTDVGWDATSESALGRCRETADQIVVRLDEIGRPMVYGFDATLWIDRTHDLLQPAHGLVPIERAGQADIDVAGRMVRHDAKAFTARE